MQQISPPLRIALVAVLVLAVLWFVALRPKSDSGADAPLATTTTTQGLPAAVKKAQDAVTTANGAVTTAEQPAEAPQTTTGSGEAQKPATGTSGVTGNPEQDELVRALDAGNVVVLLFRDASTVSDAVIRAASAGVQGRDRVVLRVVPIGQVGQYPDFTTSAAVAQAPTVLVIAPSRRAQSIVGYTTSAEIGQAIGDVRRAAVTG
ncbi:unannotated protein [freshwater metagenome]|uniref:Unannotated protein n=1 Tax=freshwater metagenome TaxID=449393 RepID=A0A6J7HVW7_9ZZZZ|nr:hypothetical protein [Actinomycetota bacterium]